MKSSRTRQRREAIHVGNGEEPHGSTLWKQFEFELTQRAARISIKSQLQLSSVKHARIFLWAYVREYQRWMARSPLEWATNQIGSQIRESNWNLGMGQGKIGGRGSGAVAPSIKLNGHHNCWAEWRQIAARIQIYY